VGEHDRVAVHVDGAGVRVYLLHDLVGVADRGQPGADVDELADPLRPGPGTPAGAPGSGGYTADFIFPEPAPAPVTTIAWRLAHIIVGVFGMRAAAHFGGPPTDYQTHRYAGTAAEALSQLDASYAAWIGGVRSLDASRLDASRLAAPCGPAEGPFSDAPMVGLVLHISREAIHHGAEIALLRDLYPHRAR